MKHWRCLLITLLFIIMSSTLVSGREIILSWEPSPSFAVKGYNVYFKRGNTDFFTETTIANEGPSPFDAGRSLTAHLKGLSDEDIYYFTVTAYDRENESDFSNIVSNSWMPPLIAPQNKTYANPLPITFQWGAHNDSNFTYTLYYGLNKGELLRAGTFVALHQQDKNTLQLVPAAPFIFTLLVLTIMTLNLLQRHNSCTSNTSRRPEYQVIAIAFMALTLTSCGGEGGGSSSVAGMTHLHTGANTYYQVFDLQPASTYFWKVVASEGTGLSKTIFHSDIYSFTTE